MPSGIDFEGTDCNHSVYVYRRGDVRILLPIHVDSLLLASDSRESLQTVKTELSSHFKPHDQSPVSSILGKKTFATALLARLASRNQGILTLF